VQLSSLTGITVNDLGGVNVGGGGGAADPTDGFGGGGGSGGSLVLQAPRFILRGTLAANGGAGGCASAGEDGQPASAAALGGSAACGRCGGSGGYGEVEPDPTNLCLGGGGGGAVGRLRLLTQAEVIDEGITSPPASIATY
jgi:hypothetical protein